MSDFASINSLPEWIETIELPSPTKRLWLMRRALRSFHGAWLVGAAAAIVDRSSASVLLVRQSYRKGHALPGGVLHRKEAPEQAIAREVFEETGLELDFAGQKPVMLIEPNLMQIHLLFGFDHPVADTRAQGRYRGEVPDSEWYPLGDLPDPIQYITLLQLTRLGLVGEESRNLNLSA